MSRYSDLNLQEIDIGIKHSVHQNIDSYTPPMHLGLLNPTAHKGSLFILSEMVGTGTVTNTTSKYEMHKNHFPAFCVTEDYEGGACESTTIMQADQLNGVIPNQVYMAECTGEQFLVKSIPNENTVVLQRGFGYYNPKPLKANDRLTLIGNAFEESSLRPQSVHGYTETMDFATQIFRNTWSLSQTANCITNNGRESARATQFKGAALNHMRDIETSLWFGERKEVYQNGQPLHRMDGFDALVYKHAPENVHFAGATTNWKQLEKMLSSVTMGAVPQGFVGAEPVLIGSQRVLQVLNDILMMQGTVQFTQGQTAFGWRFNSMTTAYGTYHFMHNPLFDTNPYWSNTLRIVNLPSLMIKYLCDRNTKHHAFNISENGKDMIQVDHGIDAMGGTFLSELTLHMISPKSNGIIHGLCAAGCPEPCVFTGWEPRALIKDECGRLRPNFDVNMDDRIDYKCGEDACIPEGLPYPERPKKPTYDKCGNLVPAKGIDYKFDCACYATEVAVDDKVESLQTTCGVITYSTPITDWSDADQVALFVSETNAFLEANGGGTASAMLIGGSYVVKVANTVCMIQCFGPEGAEFSVVS